jgi:aminopeptidase N
MHHVFSAACAAVAILAAACGAPAQPEGSAAAPAAENRVSSADVDIHSSARPAEARVTHVALDLTADFREKRLRGTARLTLTRQPNAKELLLDTSKLSIEQVTDAAGQALPFTLGAADPVLGSPLTVSLPTGVTEITIGYQTDPSAGALQWLEPSQTAGKKQPYLYSQGQAILTRSWIPTQDSPGIRQTYTARIVAPAGLRAVMSAEHLTPDGVDAAGGRAYEFRLTNPIPPYLIALAVGDLEARTLGQRTATYSEPPVVALAASEFAEVEKMVATAEALLGPYRWGRYDVLVLPPSFPFGGMENPRLTFATPTILAGDRSLVSLIAHELAHSWSGNLVTNATWSDFWLNEGVTSYVELRIMEAMYGAERAAMLEVLARRELLAEIERLGGPKSPETILHLDLKGRNPDDGATTIPYDKGSALLRLIEQTVGRDRFDAYLKGYLDRFAFQSITTGAFLADLRSHLIRGDAELEKRLRLDEWVYSPGLADNATKPHSDALVRVEEAARSFGSGTPAATVRTSFETDKWITQQWQHFLESLPKTLDSAQLSDLDRVFNLTDRRNSEVLFAWLRIGIRQRYEPAMPALERFLTSQGRRKFLRPLYEDLMATDWGKPLARKIYAAARPLYHTVATSTLDPIVFGKS